MILDITFDKKISENCIPFEFSGSKLEVSTFLTRLKQPTYYFLKILTIILKIFQMLKCSSLFDVICRKVRRNVNNLIITPQPIQHNFTFKNKIHKNIPGSFSKTLDNIPWSTSPTRSAIRNPPKQVTPFPECSIITLDGEGFAHRTPIRADLPHSTVKLAKNPRRQRWSRDGSRRFPVWKSLMSPLVERKFDLESGVRQTRQSSIVLNTPRNAMSPVLWFPAILSPSLLQNSNIRRRRGLNSHLPVYSACDDEETTLVSFFFLVITNVKL